MCFQLGVLALSSQDPIKPARNGMFESLRSQRAGDGSVAGIRQVELTRRVPGIDYFPFEAGAGCSLPRKRPQCELGPACAFGCPGSSF